jgi:predicted MFS family arabinose efflux permease
MGLALTLVIAVAILLVVSRLTWPRDARAPMPLYVGTIVAAFFIGSVAGSLVDGRDLGRSLQFALVMSAAIALVAVVSWFRVKAPGSKPDTDAAAAETEPRERSPGARRRRP